MTEFLSPKTVAAILGVKVGTLSHWRWRRCGPKWIRLTGGKTAYPARDLADFIASRPTGGGVRASSAANRRAEAMPVTVEA